MTILPLSPPSIQHKINFIFYNINLTKQKLIYLVTLFYPTHSSTAKLILLLPYTLSELINCWHNFPYSN